MMGYRGRLAPSPTGYLHAGHMATFRLAYERARENAGTLVLRVEDLDRERCKPAFVEAMLLDLKAAKLDWDEGPFFQSQRDFLPEWRMLRDGGWIYPCTCSRKDVHRAVAAPHAGEEEPLYPGTCRTPAGTVPKNELPGGVNWRFRVPPGETLEFVDGRLGRQTAIAGVDFGDFLVWRKDGVPSYQLAVVADDIAMGITEVVRGEDLLESTFRQLLLYRALGRPVPDFFHCPLVLDENGRRLAKRDGAARWTSSPSPQGLA
ncbi:MAG TPA: glutamate--tRNA ligase family protein [Chthoniobacterales bacterium]